jgi:hypothetical protein
VPPLTFGRRGWRVAALLVLTTLLTATGSAPLPVLGAQGGSPGSSSTCPLADGSPSNTGSVVGFDGRLACYRPGGERFGAQAGKLVNSGQSATPTPGGDCSIVVETPGYMSSVPYNPNGPVGGHWGLGGWVRVAFSPPILPPGWINLDFDNSAKVAGGSAYSAFVMSPADSITSASQNYMMQIRRQGTYDSNSNCKLANVLTWIGDVWTAAVPATAASSAVNWQPYIAAIAGDIVGGAGTIRATPAAKGVVNVPQCFWIDGIQIPQERDLTLVLAGAPNSEGRRVYYTFLIRIKMDGITWHFDDPGGNNNPDNPTADVCKQYPQGVSHTYHRITEGVNPDNMAHVTADESYVITADMYWADSLGGPYHLSVDPGVPAQVIHPDPYSILIGQIEGVPTS